MEPFSRYNSAILSIFMLLIFILPDHVHAFSEDLIKSRLSTADSLYQNHQYEASLQILEETLQQAKNRIGENHRLVGAIYNDLGRIHTNLGLYYDAIELHKKALSLRIAIEEVHLDVAESYNNLGVAYWYLGDHEKVRYYFTKALEIREELLGENHQLVAQSLTNLGISYRESGKYDDALSYFKQGLAIRMALFGAEHPDVANSYNHIGIIHNQRGDYFSALDNYEVALDIRKNTLDENNPAIASSYNNVASIYAKLGDIGYALHHFKRSLLIRLEIYGEHNSYVSQSYYNLANLHMMMGNYEKSLSYFQKARDIRFELVGKRNAAYANIIAQLGHLYRRMKEYNKALDYQYRALEIRLELFGENHPETARGYFDIGFTYNGMENYDEAFRFYDKSIGLHRSIFGNSHSQIAIIYTHYAIINQKLGEYDAGLQYLNRAFAILSPDFPEELQGADYNPVLVLHDTYYLKALSIRGSILSEQGHFSESLESYLAAINHIENIRTNLRSEDSNRILSERYFAIFEHGIEASLRLYKETGNFVFKQLAFEISERSKAAILRYSVAQSSARSFSQISEKLLERERDLRRQIAYYDIQFSKSESNTGEARKYRTKNLSLREDYLALIEHIEEQYPDYYDLKYRTETVTVGDIQNHLDDQTALLHYYAGIDHLYIFAITNNSFKSFTIPNAGDIEQLSNMLIHSIRKVDPTDYVASATGLYDHLIKPIRDVIDLRSELLIIPDGVLYNFPFEVLLNSSNKYEPGWGNLASLPYLIRDFSISYHYSATLLEKKSPGGLKHSEASFAGFAPIFPDQYTDYGDHFRNISLNPLPYSKAEIETLIDLMEQHGVPARGFFYGKASKENFLQNANEHTIVHIASHGIANAHQPGLSGIAFASENNSKQINMLYAREMYELDLDADLIFIGSCMSGHGEVVRGEGLFSMTRGLLYSGSSNIIVSLWEMYDRYSKDLMIEFYHSLLNGNSIAGSLREAKLAMIENEATAFPNFWSSLILIGR